MSNKKLTLKEAKALLEKYEILLPEGSTNKEIVDSATAFKASLDPDAPKNSYTIVVGDKKAYLKHPDRGVYERVIPLMTPIPGMAPPDTLKAGNIILLSCWISGDEELKNDDDYNIPACMAACGLITLKEVSIKKN